jgi:hypothetical protein
MIGKNPKSKIQVPKNSKVPILKPDASRVWSLEFGNSLELGTWILELVSPL